MRLRFGGVGRRSRRLDVRAQSLEVGDERDDLAGREELRLAHRNATRLLKLVLGVSVLFGVLALMRGFDGTSQGRWFDWLFGLISGVLNTATSTNGPPLVFVLQARKIGPAPFRATLNTVFLFSGVYAAALYAIRGEVSRDLLIASSLSLPCLLVGSVVGIRMRSKINDEMFRRGVLALLTLSGLSTIVSAL